MWYLTSGTDNLALHHMGGEAVAAAVDATGLDYFGFLVATPEKSIKWANRLEQEGVELVQQPKTHETAHDASTSAIRTETSFS